MTLFEVDDETLCPECGGKYRAGDGDHAHNDALCTHRYVDGVWTPSEPVFEPLKIEALMERHPV